MTRVKVPPPLQALEMLSEEGERASLRLTSQGERCWLCELPSSLLHQPERVRLRVASHLKGSTPKLSDGQPLSYIEESCFSLPAHLRPEVGRLVLHIETHRVELRFQPVGMESARWGELVKECEVLWDLIASDSPIGLLDVQDESLDELERLRELIMAVEKALERPKSRLITREAWGRLGELLPTGATAASFAQTLSVERVIGAQVTSSYDLPENRSLRFALEVALDRLQGLRQHVQRAQLRETTTRSELGELDELDEPLMQHREEARAKAITSPDEINALERLTIELIESCRRHKIMRAEPFKPNPTLTQSPDYARVYQAWLALDDLAPNETTENSNVEIAAPKNNAEAWRLYEAWCGLRLIAELRSLPRFKASPLASDWPQYIGELSTLDINALRPNKPLSFTLTHQERADWCVDVKLWAQREELIEGVVRRPDYVLHLTTPQGEQEVVFDAKFKRYEGFDEALIESFELWQTGALPWAKGGFGEFDTWLDEGSVGRGYGQQGARKVYTLHPSAHVYHSLYDQRPIARRTYLGGSYHTVSHGFALSERFGFISAAPGRADDLALTLKWLILYEPLARPAPPDVPCISCGRELKAIQKGGAVYRDIDEARISRDPHHNYDCECGAHLVLTRCHNCHYPLYKGGKLWSLPGLNSNYDYDCPRCAENLNESPPLIVIKEESTPGYTEIRCVKCNGRGYIGRFSHIANGECFDCYGKGSLSILKTGDEAMIQKVFFNAHASPLHRSLFDKTDLPQERRGRPLIYELESDSGSDVMETDDVWSPFSDAHYRRILRRRR